MNERDPRIDKAITWILSTVAGLSFGIAAWQFTGLANEVHSLRDTVNALNTRLAIVESAKLDERLRELEHRVDMLEAKK